MQAVIQGYPAARPKGIQVLLPLVDPVSHKSIGLKGSQRWSTKVLQSSYPVSQVLDSPAVIYHTPWFLPSRTKQEKKNILWSLNISFVVLDKQPLPVHEVWLTQTWTESVTEIANPEMPSAPEAVIILLSTDTAIATSSVCFCLLRQRLRDSGTFLGYLNFRSDSLVPCSFFKQQPNSSVSFLLLLLKQRGRGFLQMWLFYRFHIHHNGTIFFCLITSTVGASFSDSTTVI